MIRQTDYKNFSIFYPCQLSVKHCFISKKSRHLIQKIFHKRLIGNLKLVHFCDRMDLLVVSTLEIGTIGYDTILDPSF